MTKSESDDNFVEAKPDLNPARPALSENLNGIAPDNTDNSDGISLSAVDSEKRPPSPTDSYKTLCYETEDDNSIDNSFPVQGGKLAYNPLDPFAATQSEVHPRPKFSLKHCNQQVDPDGCKPKATRSPGTMNRSVSAHF